MSRRARVGQFSLWRRVLVTAAVVLIATSCASSTEVSESLSPDDVSEPVPTESVQEDSAPAAGGAAAQATECRDDGSYRARLVETDAVTSDVLTEYRYEVDDDHVRTEPAGAKSGTVILQRTAAWTFDSTGWQELPTVPVRPLRTPWVNNFVTGAAVARAAAGSSAAPSTDTLYGFDVRRVELTYEQFQDAFPQKIGDGDYDADATSFTYWLDPCDQIVRAQITTAFGPATAELMGPDFPLTLNYTYESYDIGVDFAAPVPGDPITPIPPPSDS